MLIDSHAHLDSELLPRSGEDIIDSLERDGLGIVVDASCDFQGCKNATELASKNEKVFCILGVHPECLDDWTEECKKFIEQNAGNKKVLGIGEIGLDYHSEKFDAKRQAEVFLEQARLANKFSLPVIIHLREAYGDFLKIVKENKNLFQNGMLLHCYSGSTQFAREIMALIPNVYFAFGGSCTFKNAKNLQEVVKSIPLDRILTETDSPFLTPEPFRGKEKNQPKNVELVLLKIADLKEMSKDRLEKIVEENFFKFFSKIKN